MKILYDNLVDDGSVSASSQATGYPATAVQVTHLTNKWRTTGDTSENIVIDLGAAASVDAAAICGHNLTAAATIKVQGHTSDSWAAPDVDETITAGTYDLAKFFTTASKRYWRFTFADAANPDGYIEVGRLVLAVNLTITKSFQNSFSENNVDTSQNYFSQTGQVFGVKGYRRKEYSLSFPRLSYSMTDSIKTMLDSVETTVPFVAVLDEDNMDKLHPLYCIVDGGFRMSHVWNYYYSGSLSFREVF